MNTLKVPYYDKRQRYSIDIFQNSKFQKLFALFVSKPELYQDIHIMDNTDKQDYMFYRFSKFYDKYIDLNITKIPDFDLFAYFTSLHVDKAGAVNICGGGDKLTNTRAGRKEKLDNYKESINEKKQKIKYLSEKYRLVFNNLSSDPRLFIGHQEPWLNLGVHLLEKEGFQWIIERSYTDETFELPIPENLDKDLVPLSIRNKVLQKLKKIQSDRIQFLNIKSKKSIDEDNEEEEKEDKEEKQKNIPSPTSVILNYDNISDEDW